MAWLRGSAAAAMAGYDTLQINQAAGSSRRLDGETAVEDRAPRILVFVDPHAEKEVWRTKQTRS